MTRTVVLSAALTLGLAAPASAAPGVATGGVANVGESTATLTGGVNPAGRQTSYFFQYGTSTKYGARTASRSAGNGRSRVDVTVPVVRLTPNTLYHYRLVAVGGGTKNGSDRTFRTARLANTISLGATPEPASFGGSVLLAGQVGGSAAAGARVTLQGRLFPYTLEFGQIGNAVLAGSDGRFALTVAPLIGSTQFRAVTQPAGAPSAVFSGVVGVRARVAVSLGLSATRVNRGRGVHLQGTVRPSLPGTRISIQRRGRDGGFHTVARTTLRTGTAAYARYDRTIHPSKSGDFRTSVVVSGRVYNGTSTTRHISVRRR